MLALTLFLVLEQSFTIEGKATGMNKNVTLISKPGQYLTIKKQGISGHHLCTSYGKTVF